MFCHRLLGEAFLIDAVNGVMNIGEVLEHEYGIVGKKREERDFLLRNRQFGNNRHFLTLVFRQLRVDLENPDGIDVITEEVDAEGILAAEAIDVKDTATQGKLPRLIDIIHLMEAKLAQGVCGLAGIDGVSLL